MPAQRFDEFADDLFDYDAEILREDDCPCPACSCRRTTERAEDLS